MFKSLVYFLFILLISSLVHLHFLIPLLPSLLIFVISWFTSIPIRNDRFALSTVWGEAGSEAWAPGEQPERRGQWGWGGGRWRRLWLRRRVLSQSPLLWLHQAGPVLCDGDGTVRPATQAPPHRDQKLPSCQPEVNDARGTVPEEGRSLTWPVNDWKISVQKHLLILNLTLLKH